MALQQTDAPPYIEGMQPSDYFGKEPPRPVPSVPVLPTDEYYVDGTFPHAVTTILSGGRASMNTEFDHPGSAPRPSSRRDILRGSLDSDV